MSEPLSEDQLAELIRNGRISTSKSAAKRRQSKRNYSINKPSRTQTSAPRVADSPQGVNPTTTLKEVDPLWLEAEKEKAERNISAQRQDKRRIEELREASRY